MEEIASLIEVVKSGSRPEIKQAHKQLDKIFLAYRHDKKKQKLKAKINAYLQQQAEQLETIPDLDHQVALISAFKSAFWYLDALNFEFWSQFIFHYIQHPSGKVRQAILFAADIFFMTITFDLHDFAHSSKTQPQLSPAQALFRFGSSVMRAEALLDTYSQPRYHRYKYISSLPAGVYKSLQKLLVEVLLRSEFYEDQYQVFLNHMDLMAQQTFDPDRLTN